VVTETTDNDEELPGVLASVQQAAKALHKQKEEAAKKAQEEFEHIQN
jgi:hypothetical protein